MNMWGGLNGCLLFLLGILLAWTKWLKVTSNSLHPITQRYLSSVRIMQRLILMLQLLFSFQSPLILFKKNVCVIILWFQVPSWYYSLFLNLWGCLFSRTMLIQTHQESCLHTLWSHGERDGCISCYKLAYMTLRNLLHLSVPVFPHL